jgi:hypothetical protein
MSDAIKIVLHGKFKTMSELAQNYTIDLLSRNCDQNAKYQELDATL